MRETGADRSAWRADEVPQGAARPRLALVPPATTALAPPGRGAGHLGRLLDGVLAESSLVPNDPVLDVRAFPWTQTLRDDWRAIAAELPDAATFPASGVVRIDRAGAQFAATLRALAAVPGLDSADFALLAPGAHLPARRGPSKALITCHLGLAIPRCGDVRMRIGERTLRWAEGETLVFDDTRTHEAWNDACAARIVLRVRFRRPLRQPGRWVAERLLGKMSN